MGNAKRDDNYVPTLIAVSNADGSTPVTLYADPTTHRLLVSATMGALDDLSDVVITSGAQGDILYNNGTNWVNLAAGTTGKFLKTQGAGANPMWDTPTAGAAGSDTHVQFNDGGTVLGGDAGMTYNKTTDTLTLAGNLQCEDLALEDSDASHRLVITTTSNLTADRILTLVPGDAARTITLAGNINIAADLITSGANSLTLTTTGVTDVTLPTTGTLSILGANTFTALQTISLAGVGSRVVNTTDNASVQVAKLEGDRATMADNDEAYLSLMLSDDGGTQTEFGRITWVGTDVNVGTSVDGRLDFAVVTAGSLADEMQLDGTALSPSTSDGLQLGTTSLMWSDLFLADSSVINFNNGDVTLTHGANVLTLGGGDLALGANNLTITGSIAATGARVTKGWFTDIESTNMPTVGGTAILSSLTAPTFNTIELGTGQTDTTLSRVSAGVVAIEGVNVLTVAGGTLTGAVNLGENAGLAYDATLSADEKWSGITTSGTLGATIGVGDIVYLAAVDSRWELADASAASTSGDVPLAICLVAGNDGDATTLLLVGKVRSAAFPAFTVATPLYVSETAGDITGTAPTTTDSVMRRVGFALTAEDLYFNPSNDYITHT